MILILAVILPLFIALAISLLGGVASSRQRGRDLLLVGAIAHLLLCALALWLKNQWSVLTINGQQWLALDQFSSTILLLTSALFVWVAIHCRQWLKSEQQLRESDLKDLASRPRPGLLPEWIFLSCLLVFLAAMTLAICSTHLGLLWVAIEATTLVSAPLICYHRSAAALEAMWKYLLICSVGIGLALLGTFFIVIAGGGDSSLNLGTLAAQAESLDPQWSKAAFIFILVGYGTKMGLAPFHTWLPDAHSEAPAPVSALLSAALLNCSFLGILRFTKIMPSSLHGFCRTLLLALGFLSLATAAFFIIRQYDFKRMLAYSSVEHMGLLALLWGCGMNNPTMQTATMWHLIGHSLLKMVLFLTAGNILLAYGTRLVNAVKGMFGSTPKNAFLFITAVLLVCGSPPSPLFITELLLVCELGPKGGAVVLLLLLLVLGGMLSAALRMCMGENTRFKKDSNSAQMAEELSIVPTIILLLAISFGSAICIWLAKTNLWQ